MHLISRTSSLFSAGHNAIIIIIVARLRANFPTNFRWETQSGSAWNTIQICRKSRYFCDAQEYQWRSVLTSENFSLGYQWFFDVELICQKLFLEFKTLIFFADLTEDETTIKLTGTFSPVGSNYETGGDIVQVGSKNRKWQMEEGKLGDWLIIGG